MGPIEEAINEFQERQLNVYKADPDRIVRDTRVAERAAKDHVGRWFFELLQNSDDAMASKVSILFEDDAVYVADNGSGIKSQAVSAICGTDFSDKKSGTIGRKGVGFKSVYEITINPQVITVNGEGIEFSPSKTQEWLREKNFSDQYHQYPPFQWIPFFLSWENAISQYPVLSTFCNYKTIVRLPINSNENQTEKIHDVLREFLPHTLLAFRHVQEIKTPDFEIILIPGDDIWEMRDSREDTPILWRVAKCNQQVPEEFEASLGKDEWRAICTDGVSFMVAAPIQENCVGPTENCFPVHVFYPTDQLGPVRLLLHAEFLVKSDRTALMPIEDSTFNQWIAERLALHICDFVQDSYSQEKPSHHL
ncbi:MAG: ATP-binding protein, partial [Candidatus Glassbacteria bacterium]|nr:ATP-binding protein [Candidatus Glassbacteria bacterium]